MKNDLAKLRKVSLRKFWDKEPEFTNWLAENLGLLGEEIGVGIQLRETEASVGSFRVDILAEEDSGRKIVIENQIEDTDHDHLGKIITYASGYDAKMVIWIVRDVTDEHKRAVEWLNERTDNETGFFLIKAELWQIEDSKPAPKFDVLVSPNEWAKAVKAKSAKELSETKLQYLKFWTEFSRFVERRDPSVQLQKPSTNNWRDIRIGTTTMAHVVVSVSNRKEKALRCSLYIRRSKELFSFFMENKEAIEKEIGEECEWKDNQLSSIISLGQDVSDIFGEDEREKNFDWLYEKSTLFREVFLKRIEEFDGQ